MSWGRSVSALLSTAAVVGWVAACQDQTVVASLVGPPECAVGACHDAGKARRDAKAGRIGDPDEPGEPDDDDSNTDESAPLKGDSNLRIVAANLTSGNHQ